ncbi:MAG TPA: ribonuclease P protein component [Candidatus Gastranaerophilales bacterium]|nr:ribonuclease P protein component [Candidatus Gastranaerophilales bacterium]
MLPKQERLTKSREFAYIYRIRKSVANSLLILYVGNIKQNKAMPTKVGFVVGKKVHKRAVKRNKIKRRVREAYRELRKAQEFKLKDYKHLIFIARPAIIESDYSQIFNAVEDCLNKASKRFGE